MNRGQLQVRLLPTRPGGDCPERTSGRTTICRNNEVGERRATDIPPSDPYRAGHHRRVSSRPLPHRACGSPAHGVPPGSRWPAFRVATPLANHPSARARTVTASGHRGLGHTALLPADVQDPETHARLQVLRWGRLCCPCPSSLLLPALTSAARKDRFVGCTYRPRLLPGTTGRQARGHQMPVRRRISPVPCSAVHTFRSPYAGRFFRVASPRSSPVPWPSPNGERLGSVSFPPQNGGMYHDAAGFASSYGPRARSTPNGAFVVALRRIGSLLAPATSYTAAWSLPWPDLHRLVEHSFQDAPPSNIMPPTRNQPGPSAEVSQGVRGHTPAPQRAHAPPHPSSKPGSADVHADGRHPHTHTTPVPQKPRQTTRLTSPAGTSKQPRGQHGSLRRQGVAHEGRRCRRPRQAHPPLPILSGSSHAGACSDSRRRRCFPRRPSVPVTGIPWLQLGESGCVAIGGVC
jgi:hypothetical protein